MPPSPAAAQAAAPAAAAPPPAPAAAPPAPAGAVGVSRKAAIGIVLGTLLPIVVLIATGLTTTHWRTGGLLALWVFAVVFWTTEPAPTAYTSLAVLFGLVASGIQTFPQAWAAGSDAAFWLTFFGMALATALAESRLLRRLSSLVFVLVQARSAVVRKDASLESVAAMEDHGQAQTHMRRLATGPLANLRLYAVLALLGAAVALVVPSGVVRVILLSTVANEVVATIERSVEGVGGLELNRRALAGIICSLLFGTQYPGTGVLTGSTPNILVLSTLEGAGIRVFWGDWAGALMLVSFGLQAVVVPLVVWLLLGRAPLVARVHWRDSHGSDSSSSKEEADERALRRSDSAREPLLFNPHSGSLNDDGDARRGNGNGQVSVDVAAELLVPTSQPPLTLDEGKLLAIALVSIVLWATDVFHKIPPVQVALLAVLLAYFPIVGPTPFDKIKQVNFPVLLYITALLALGDGINSDETLVVFIETMFASLLSLGGSSLWLKYYFCVLAIIPFTFLMECAAATAVVAPVLVQLAPAVGLDMTLVGYAIAIGANVVFMPYQSAPFLIGYTTNAKRVGLTTYFVTMSATAVVSLGVLAPLNILWWLR